jgi:hypothetical protein
MGAAVTEAINSTADASPSGTVSDRILVIPPL